LIFYNRIALLDRLIENDALHSLKSLDSDKALLYMHDGTEVCPGPLTLKWLCDRIERLVSTSAEEGSLLPSAVPLTAESLKGALVEEDCQLRWCLGIVARRVEPPPPLSPAVLAGGCFSKLQGSKRPKAVLSSLGGFFRADTFRDSPDHCQFQFTRC
jgi:hypothetical protein